MACQQNHLACVQSLLKQGADANLSRSIDGLTPLFLACQNDFSAIAIALLRAGADANRLRNDDDVACLFIASQGGEHPNPHMTRTPNPQNANPTPPHPT